MDRTDRCASCGHPVPPRLAQAYDGACPWCLAQVTFGPEAQPQVKTGAEPSGRLGRYVRTEKLGSGGMGEVWKALDTELNRWVALKFLKEEEPAFVARFLREARTSAGLSHPGIAAIYEVGEAEGRRFIAMQYVPGRTMDSIPWKDRRLLVRLFRDVARALDHAHKSGVIHRDLKPANLIVEEKGDRWSVSILDFGLARPIEGGERLSKSGEVFGTVPYMSPEQSRGEALDVRADVYSLGATMYELLTGRPPFVGRNLVELIRKIGSEEPSPLRKVDRAIDGDLETIVMTCLQKDRRRRYPSARALAADLDRWLKREPILARPPSALYRLRMGLARRKAATAAVAAGLALASVVAWWAMVGSPGAEQARLSAEAMKSWAEARGLAMAGVDPEGIRRRARAAREAFDRAIAVKEDAPSLVMKSRCLQLEARDDDALKAARRAHELDPANAEARLELAKLLLSKYRESRGTPGFRNTSAPHGGKAKLTFEKLAPESPEQRGLREEAKRLLASGRGSPAQASFLEGLESMGRSEHSRAAEAFEAYAKLESWDAHGFRLAGINRYLSSDFPGAVSALDQSLLRVPKAAGFRWRGIAKHAQGLLEPALEDMTKAIELDRNDAAAYSSRGWVKARMGRHGEAIADYTKAIEVNPKLVAAYVNRGIARKLTGAPNEAMADYNRVIEIDPGIAEAYGNRGTVKDEKGDFDGAIADYTKAIEIEPTYTSAYSNRALAKCSKGLFDEAIADYSKAIELDPGMAVLYTNRGTAKASKRLYDEAIADHNKAIELEPDFAAAYSHRGGALADKGLRRQAIADFETALKLAPPDWPHRSRIEKVLQNLERHTLCAEGDELFERRNFREALRKYAEIVKRWPEAPAAVAAAYNCACGHALLGEKTIALDWLEKAVEIGWKDADHLEKDSDLDSLRDDERYKKLVAKLKDM